MIEIEMLKRNLSDALKDCENAMIEGESTHKEDEWKSGSTEEDINKHIRHAYVHLISYVGDPEHLRNAATRCLMALQRSLDKRDV